MPPSAALALVLVGAVLFVNGLGLLGKVSKGAAGTLNVFVGVLLAVVVLSLALPAEDTGSVFTASGFLLFGIVYLYAGVMDLTGHSGDGVGWYCACAAAVSLAISLVEFLRDGDVKLGTIWLLWTLLFAMFFLVFGLELAAVRALTGWITITESVITATVPGLLILLGLWDEVPDLAVVIVAATAATAFAVMGLRVVRAASRSPTR